MSDEKYEELMAMPATELVDYVLGLESKLRDASDLLNDCGYYLVKGTWVDGDNPENVCECNNLDHQTLNVDCPINYMEELKW